MKAPDFCADARPCAGSLSCCVHVSCTVGRLDSRRPCACRTCRDPQLALCGNPGRDPCPHAAHFHARCGVGDKRTLDERPIYVQATAQRGAHFHGAPSSSLSGSRGAVPSCRVRRRHRYRSVRRWCRCRWCLGNANTQTTLRLPAAASHTESGRRRRWPRSAWQPW